MIVGIDIHGVIDANPNFFSSFSHLIREKGDRLCIITGKLPSSDLIKKLISFDVVWDEFYSIAGTNFIIGNKVDFTDRNNPWTEDSAWNKTKGLICKQRKIDIHIDDSNVYAWYFEPNTVYLKYVNKFECVEFNTTGLGIQNFFIENDVEKFYDFCVNRTHGNLVKSARMAEW